MGGTENSSDLDLGRRPELESDEFSVPPIVVIEKISLLCLKPLNRCGSFWEPDLVLPDIWAVPCAVQLVFQTEQAEQERGAIGAGDEGSVVHRVPDGVAEAVGAMDGARRAGFAHLRAVREFGVKIQRGGQQAGRGEVDEAVGIMEEECEAGEGSQAARDAPQRAPGEDGCICAGRDCGHGRVSERGCGVGHGSAA